MKNVDYALIFLGFIVLLLLFVRLYDRILFEVILWFLKTTCLISIIAGIGLFLLGKIFED